MIWNHILDLEPENDTVIIQLDPPIKKYYEGDWDTHYNMGIRQYKNFGMSIHELVKYNLKHDMPNPNFWWVYANEFPFPHENNDDEMRCRFCENHENIISESTCCTGCSMLQEKNNEYKRNDDGSYPHLEPFL